MQINAKTKCCKIERIENDRLPNAKQCTFFEQVSQVRPKTRTKSPDVHSENCDEISEIA